MFPVNEKTAIAIFGPCFNKEHAWKRFVVEYEIDKKEFFEECENCQEQRIKEVK